MGICNRLAAYAADSWRAAGSIPEKMREAIDRLQEDRKKDLDGNRKKGQTEVKGVGRVSSYVSRFAKLLAGDGGLSGPGDITARTYNDGEYPAKGFWCPEKRILGIQNPEESMSAEEAHEYLRALIGHETGHIRHTDPALMETNGDLKKDKILMHLLNIFEDPRVERLQAEDYPGEERYLRGLRSETQEECMEEFDKELGNPLAVTLGIASEMGLKGEIIDEKPYVENMKKAFPDDPGLAEAFVQDITEAARETLAAESTGDVLKVTRKLRVKYFPESEEEEGEGEGEGEGGEGAGSGKVSRKALAKDMEKIEKIMKGGKLEQFAGGGSQPSDIYDDDEGMDDPTSQFDREDEPLGGREWADMLGHSPRRIESSMATRMQKFGAMNIIHEQPDLGRSGRVVMRQVFKNTASNRPSLDVFRSDEDEQDPTFYLLLIIDGSGSMNGSPTHEGCKIAYSLARKQMYDPAFKVRILLCNSECRNPLLIKDYDIPLTNSGIHALKTFHSNGAGEGLITSEPYFKHPRTPDMALFLTDGCVVHSDVEWLKKIRRYVPIRAAYVGGSTSNVEAGFKQTFGANAYIMKRTAEELGLHLDRLLNTFVRST